jgi:hypothetical protein
MVEYSARPAHVKQKIPRIPPTSLIRTIMAWVPSTSPGSLARALFLLGDQGAERILKKDNGVAILARLSLLKALMDDRSVLASRFVIKDRRGCVLEARREIFEAAGRAPLSPRIGLAAAVHEAKRLLQARDARRAAKQSKVAGRPKARRHQERAAA